jgi:hypothetical protein
MMSLTPLATSSSSSFIVQINAPGATRPVFHNYLLRPTDTTPVLLPSAADYDRIYWSPDSQSLMYYQTGSDGRLVLKMIDVTQSQPDFQLAYQFPVQSVRLWTAYQSDNLIKWRPQSEG